MNTPTTEATAQAAADASTHARKATLGKRRMARQAGNPATPGAASAHDKPQAAAAPARAPSKIASVIALLERPEGSTLAEMVEATGWLPHTTRAALTGLKKKGRTITKDKRDDATCYRIVKAG
jgi:hypothetical protein